MSRIVAETLEEAEELVANGLITEKQYDDLVAKIKEEEKYKLRFKHIHIDDSFTYMTSLYIRISENEAVNLKGVRREFDLEEEVSKIEKISYKTFDGAECKMDFDREAYNKYKKMRVEKFGQTVKNK